MFSRRFIKAKNKPRYGKCKNSKIFMDLASKLVQLTILIGYTTAKYFLHFTSKY